VFIEDYRQAPNPPFCVDGRKWFSSIEEAEKYIHEHTTGFEDE
jgi:hypothetical protein